MVAEFFRGLRGFSVNGALLHFRVSQRGGGPPEPPPPESASGTNIRLLIVLTWCLLVYDLCCARDNGFRLVVMWLKRWLWIFAVADRVTLKADLYFFNTKTSMQIYNVTSLFYFTC